MLKQLYYQFRMDTRNEAGRFAAYLKFPKKLQRNMEIPFCILKLFGFFAVRFIYIFIFMFVPCAVLASLRGAAGFPFLESMVYFTVVLSCVCGSLVNSSIFDMDDDTYVALTTMRMEPASFFKGRIIFKLLVDAAGFFVSYLILGMGMGYAFYLVIWLLVGRTIGEAVNLYVFRYSGKAIHELPAVSMVLMGATIILAYAFPYIRGHVVNFTQFTYDYLWMAVALTVGALVLYGLFIYGGYPYVARRFANRIEAEMGEEREAKKEEINILMSEMSDDKGFKPYEKDTSKGNEYIHKIFFARSREYIKNVVFVRIMIIVTATVAGVIICMMSGSVVKETVWNALCSSLPLLVFIMFCMSITPNVCKALFFHMDGSMLSERNYKTGVNNFRNYIIRLKKISLLDLGITLVMCVAIGIVGYSTGNSGNMEKLVPVYIGMLMMSVFFTIFYLTVYYMCQPYTKELKIKNYMYLVVHAVMLLIAYACVYVSVSAVVFDIFTGVILAVVLSGSSTLIYYLSDRTFKVQ